MRVARQQLPLYNFSGGLNTSANPMAMKQPDAVELLNMNILLSGGLERRRGVEFIGLNREGKPYLEIDSTNYLRNGEVVAPSPSFGIFTVIDSNKKQKTVVVLHVGKELRVYDFAISNSLSAIDAPLQTIDISSYMEDDAIFHRTTFSYDRGKLFLTNKFINPGYVYLKDDDTFDFSPITITKRDLEGNPNRDSMVNRGNKTYLCITDHTSSSSNAPGTGDDWKLYWVLFGPETKIPEIPNEDPPPEYIKDPDYQVQEWSSGKGYKTNVRAISGNFETCVFSSGRLWLTGLVDTPNTIYFSQTATDDLKYGRMYQFSDPLSMVDSEPVETDGGTIIINGAEVIHSIEEFQNGLIVLASNGVWYISGSSPGEPFDPTSFSVDLVSSDGCVGPFAHCKIEDRFVYFGSGGIYVITKDSIVGSLKPEDISIKIEDLYTSIPNINKYSSEVVYNPASRKLIYFCNFDSYPWMEKRNPFGQPTAFTDALVFDTGVNGWTKFSVNKDEFGKMPFIGKVLPYPSRRLRYENVTTLSQENITLEDEVTNVLVEDSIQGHVDAWRDLCIISKIGTDTVNFAFGDFTGDGFTDFNLDEEAVNEFSSVFKSAYLNMQTSSDRQTPQAFLVFERTESGKYDQYGEDITASGCFLQTAFSWKTKLGVKRQVYQPYTYTQLGYDGETAEKEVVTKKIRIKGSGNTMQFALTNDGTKNFKFYGVQLGVELVRENP